MHAMMDLNALARPASRTWAVTPCQSEVAFGVPLLRVFAQDGTSTETAVTPLDRLNETSPDAGALLGTFASRPDISALVAGATDGVDPGLALAIEAFLTHKRLVPPAGQGLQPFEPTAGLWLAVRGTSPAFAVARTRDWLGVLTLRRTHAAARLEAAWVDPVMFRPDLRAFVDQCAGVTHDDLLAGLSVEAPALAVEGIERLARDTHRALPNQVLGAMLTTLGSRIAGHHQQQARIDQLMDRLAAVETPISREDYVRYAAALTTIRQLLKILTDRRGAVDAETLDRCANLPSWHALMDSLIEQVATVCAIVDGGRPPSAQVVRAAIAEAARAASDAEVASMPTAAGRLVGGVAALAMSRTDVSLSDGTIAGRFRVLAQLLGGSDWVVARPYEHGILASVMGGW